MSVESGAASIYGTKKLKIVTKDPASVPFQIDFQFGWSWQREITVSNAGADLSDYQVCITLNTAAIIAAGKMQALGQDIRVTDADGTTELPFYVDSINTASTKIWVKVPSVPSGSKYLYLYYGNLYAADTKSGANTFIFFDDFSSGDLSKWNVTQSSAGYVSLVSGELRITGNNAWNTNGVTSKTAIPRPCIIEWDSKFSTGNVDSLQGYSPAALDYATGLYFEIGGSTATYRLLNNVRSANFGTLFGTTYTHQKICLKSTTGYTVYYADVQKEDSAAYNTDNLYVGFQFFRLTNYMYVDNVRVRKYAATEPTITVGAEVSAVTGIGSALQHILKVDAATGNLGLRDTSPANILTVMQGSITDPIADSWTTHPCDRTTKTIIRELITPEVLPEIEKIRLYEWIKKSKKKSSMPKFQALRYGIMIDDPEVPERILTYDLNGKLQGIDLLGYVGYLHVAVKELSAKVAALEGKLPP